MYFLFYVYGFDVVMRLECLKILKIDFLDNKKSFWNEIKDIIPSFTELSFRLIKKQTSRSAAGRTFNNKSSAYPIVTQYMGGSWGGGFQEKGKYLRNIKP